MSTATTPAPAPARESVAQCLRRKLTTEIAWVTKLKAEAEATVAELTAKEDDLWDALGNAAQLP